MKPLNSIFLANDKAIIELSKDQISPEKIGEKAYGMCCLPKQWTLPFIVISSNLSTQFFNSEENNLEILLDRWIVNIKKAASMINIYNEDLIFIRSSGYSEGLSERGMYYSYEGRLQEVRKPLLECLKKLSQDKDIKRKENPLILQKRLSPVIAKGHLSNERTWYEEKRDWLGSYDEIKGIPSKLSFKINIRFWRKKINLEEYLIRNLSCHLLAHIKGTLEAAATWACNKDSRIHFEWVWDGKCIYIVQADREKQSDGCDPTKINISLINLLPNFLPKCLKKINEGHAKKFHKIGNILIYKKLHIPTIELFILDDQITIDNLAVGEVSENLKNDLRNLVKASLVIRMDIESGDKEKRQLLPRTNEVRTLEGAINFLKAQSAEIKRIGHHDSIAFIFHNFIPAVSSAFAYAAPGERKVQIEALWGLPEGLYYNSHDKYIVDTMSAYKDHLVNSDFHKFKIDGLVKSQRQETFR